MASGGSPRYCGCPLPISCSVHLSHLNPKAPASASTLRRRRPLVLPRGGAVHRNRFSARPVPQAGGGVLGGRAGRLGAGPQGAKPGGDSGPKHQGPGACGAPWAAPSPLFSQARTLKPSLPRTLCFVGLTKGAILMLLPQPCPIPMDSLGGFLLRPVGVGVGCGFLSGERNSRFDSFQETRGPSSRMLLRKKAAAGDLVPTSSLSCTP